MPEPAKKPREGFTTGSAAAAAAKAALSVLLGGPVPESVFVPQPPGEDGAPAEARLCVPILSARREGEGDTERGAAAVVKDGGDDPDATHGMTLIAEAAAKPFAQTACVRLAEDIFLYAGEGIGIATLPGLPVAVGEPAINPAPRRQIAAALREAAAEHGYKGPIYCRIFAPEGEIRAKRTLNARLGILGGISVLGTSGTVKAFSADAWRETIRQALDVAKAAGCGAAAFSTGRRSEKHLQRHLPHLPLQAFVQVADHAAFSMAEAARRNFGTVAWGCFPGKLLKLAQGEGWTHAHGASPDFALLAEIFRASSVPEKVIAAATAVPTVLGALEIVRADSPQKYGRTAHLLAKRAAVSLRGMAAEPAPPAVTLYVFDMQGRLLAKGYA